MEISRNRRVAHLENETWRAFPKVLKSVLARKVFFLSLFFSLPVIFVQTNSMCFFDLGKLKMFLLSKLWKSEFLVMNFVYVN